MYIKLKFYTVLPFILNAFCFHLFQKVLADFVNIEMLFHAKALEVYTQCFQNISGIDIDEDIEVRINHCIIHYKKWTINSKIVKTKSAFCFLNVETSEN